MQSTAQVSKQEVVATALQILRRIKLDEPDDASILGEVRHILHLCKKCYLSPSEALALLRKIESQSSKRASKNCSDTANFPDTVLLILEREIQEERFDEAIRVLADLFATVVHSVEPQSLSALLNFVWDCDSLRARLERGHKMMALHFVGLLKDSIKEVIRDGVAREDCAGV